MGMIREGSISGNIPEQQHFAVKYPGYPTSLARAVETLGGEHSISKVRSSDANYLELRFRPEDPHSHPVFGELRRTSGLLLRVSQQSKGDVENSPSRGDLPCSKQIEKDNGGLDKEGSLEICADIVSRIHQTYNFDGMADYQYILPAHTKLSNGVKFRHTNTCDEKRGLVELEEAMIIVPPLFSLKDIPEDVVLHSSSRATKKKKFATNEAQKCAIANAGVDFKVEDVPVESSWHQSLVEHSDDWRLYSTLAKLFAQRPIWTKPMLWAKLVDENVLVTNYHFKRFLSKMAYHFLYGPFRTLWIRNGYDPRKDPESRKYQMVDFRIPSSVRKSFLNPESGNFDKAGFWKDLCAFKVAPRNLFSNFELCELTDDFIQMQIAKPPEREFCDEFSGWFRRGTLHRIHQQVRRRIISLIPGDAARALEVLEQRNLERPKIKRGLSSSMSQHLPLEEERRDVSLNENIEDKQATQLHTDEENAERDDEEDGGDDDDENEYDDDDENEDDNYEEREELDPDGDEDEDEEYDSISQILEGQKKGGNLQHGSEYPVTNIPENFLQALLEKFPVPSEKTKLEFPQESIFGEDDSEYSIYEQDDDDENND